MKYWINWWHIFTSNPHCAYNFCFQLSTEIEDQMFNLYQKDIGSKYKTKYRSLMFNIKDDKNNGLYRKIVNGIIKPKDLVNFYISGITQKTQD